MYSHRQWQSEAIDLPVGKVVCVGRNYLDHIAELNNEVPDEALLFMKPSTALTDMTDDVVIPGNAGECHNELELAILINKPLTSASELECKQAIWGVGLALDLTLRDVQSKLKSKGQPWERAKSFDGSCPTSPFIPLQELGELQDLTFSLKINGEIKQQGQAALMMRSVLSLLSDISSVFTLLPGDIVLTGTPKGVGPLFSGDVIEAELDQVMCIETKVFSK